jgi:hypothetical protein
VHGERLSRSFWLTAAACASTLALTAGPAHAADAVIDGSPLNIYANDQGQLQVSFDGSPTGEFAPPSLAPAQAGVNVAVAEASPSPQPQFTVFGFRGAPFTQPTAPTVTGDGSAANPWTLTTNYRADTPTANQDVVVAESITYVNGTTDVKVQYAVFNLSDGATLNVRLYAAGNLFAAGDDSGAGFLEPGPPRALGAINQAAGGSVRLVEQTPAWSHAQEGRAADVFAVVPNPSLAAQGFNDSIEPGFVDDGAGAQWNFPNVTTVLTAAPIVTMLWRFKRFAPLQLAAVSSTRATGQLATVTVSAQSDGAPAAGAAVRYAIAGANPGSGAVTTGADGNAAITWAGANVGTDTLTAFIDANNNGVRDAGEPQQTVDVVWTAPPPPVPGKSVVVKVVSGTVFVKYPPGYVPRAAPAPPAGFVPFKGGANLPVGTQLDTTRGRVALTSAADTGGAKTQTSDFYDGIFQIRQSVPKKKPKKPAALITDVVLKGEISRSQCAPLKGARGASVSAAKKKKGPKAVLGKLWGSGKGKFRTGGKYSSATVRGTIWLVQDECDGTFTKVRRGTVQVRDLRRKKTVTVKAGHTYLARAQRAATKRRRGG